MFLVERKIVHVGTEKIITLFCISNKFTLNWKILDLLLLSQKIKQLQKNGKKYVYAFLNYCSFLSAKVTQW
jgi:hypothetical protein